MRSFAALRTTRPVREAALVFLAALVAYQVAIVWLDNVHVMTANGMYKAIQVEPWIADMSTARLDNSNYLYFPLYGLLCRLLDAVGIWRGVPWKQLAVLNGAFGAAAVACLYAFVRAITGDGRAAALAALFHFGCGFVLLLGVINEDIMPGYALLLGAMCLAAFWFDQPTVRRVLIVAALFTLAWLMEWRLLFPTLPALVLALAMAPGSLARRASMVGVLLTGILATAGIVVLATTGHPGGVGLHDVLWTGKGVATGWAGLNTDKFWLMLAGVGNYLLLIAPDPDVGAIRRATGPLVSSVVAQAMVLILAVRVLWPRRGEPRVRALAAVFLGTFGAGEVFNLYSQPQDPQMQINVMPWLAVAVGVVAAAMFAQHGRLLARALVLAVPLAWNVVFLAGYRGDDGKWLAALGRLEKELPPEKTVFVYWGFEPVSMWHYAKWSRTWDWDGKPNDARFKWIALTAGAIRHPAWTAQQHAEALKRDIDAAFARGYRVVAGPFWIWKADELAGALGTLSAAGRAEAIHAALHGSYTAMPVYKDPQAGQYYELTRK